MKTLIQYLQEAKTDVSSVFGKIYGKTRITWGFNIVFKSIIY